MMISGTETTGRPARILIVDDELLNRQLLEVMLAPEGYDLMTAKSGEEALAMVAEHPFDLVLLDIMMPGTDGYQVATQIKSREKTRDIFVVLLSALDDRNSRTHGLGAGADAFLTKPIDRVELCARVSRLLGTRHRNSANAQ